MLRHSKLSSIALLILTLALSFPVVLMAQQETTITSVSSIVDISMPGVREAVDSGSSTLVRQSDGVLMMFQVVDLVPGDVYTIWWDIQGSMYFADGQVIGEDGMGIFATFLSTDDTQRPFDPMTAEIKLIARTHGPVIPEIIDEMISTVDGGCAINSCANFFESVHLPSTLTEQAETSQATQNAEIAIRIIQEIWNEPDEDVRAEVAGELYPSRFDFHSPTEEGVMGCPRSIFLEGITTLHQNISDLQIEVESIVANEDQVVVQYTLTGIAHGSSMDLADGTSISLPNEPVIWDGVFIYRFEDGQVAEEWWYWDNPFAE